MIWWVVFVCEYFEIRGQNVDKKQKRSKKRLPSRSSGVLKKRDKTLYFANYFAFSSIATATATVIPTMGLLPAPMRPIISTSKVPKRHFCKGIQQQNTSLWVMSNHIIPHHLFTIQGFHEQFNNFLATFMQF